MSVNELNNQKELEEIAKAKAIKENLNNSNNQLHNALIENYNNASADINRLLKSRKVINGDGNDRMDNYHDIKYTLPNPKSKKEYQDDMENKYYDNDTVIFRNNYTIVPIAEQDEYNTTNSNQANLDFDEELKIEEELSEKLLTLKDLDTCKFFYNIYTEQEMNEKVKRIVEKVIPEESKNFKTSLPLFDALSAVEKFRSSYVNVVEKLNSINDIYERWVEGMRLKNNVNKEIIFILKINYI